MAVYVPASRRRRRLALLASAGFLAGALVGAFAGRATAPTVDERVRAAQGRARGLAAGLRVVALHEEAGAASTQGPGDAGADLALRRTRAGLRDLLAETPWVPHADGARLTAAVSALQADKATLGDAELAARVEAVASDIERTFGLRAPP